MHRATLLAAVLALLPASALAQAERGVLASYGTDGGHTELTTPRFAAYGGYTAGAAGPSGAYLGLRYIFGIHVLDADGDRHRLRLGLDEGEVSGGRGTLLGTGVDFEFGWQVGVVRPYGFAGYHLYRQSVEPTTVAVGDVRIEVDGEWSAGFSPSRGYGVAIDLYPGAGVFAERYRGGGRDGVMVVSGTRFGVRFVL